MQTDNSNSLDLLKAQAGANAALGAAQKAARSLKGADASQAAGKTSEADKKRWKAALDFESMFLGQMYKSMRQGDSFGSELTQASPGREIFTEMLDQEYAKMHANNKAEAGSEGMRKAAAGVSNSLAAQIYRSLTRNGQDTVSAASSAPSGLPDLGAASDDAGDDFSGLSAAGLAIPGPRHAAASKTAPALADAQLDPLVSLASRTYGVSDTLIKSVVQTESAGHPLAVSTAGAKGLMQLMDSTAQDLGVSDVFNPKENVLAGTRYLKQLLDKYGDEKTALAAYNAGPAAVDHYQGIPPFAETRDYVDRVLKTKSGLDAARKAK